MRTVASQPASGLRAAWLASALLTLAALLFRPLTPTDEARYVTVAWEMWNSGDAISLTLNGELYGHKPPLLFWLVHAGWSLFGLNEWWPRVIVGLFALGALALAARIVRQLAPDRDDLVSMTLLITVSTLYWMVFSGAVMFDMMLSCFVLLGISAVIQAAAGGGWGAWAVAGLALGLGILTKGPVALLHVLPLALLAPWWRARWLQGREHTTLHWGRWYAGLGLAVVVAAAVALSWAVPSALAGGKEFGREIFWSQTVDRIATTVHHLRPFWFYAAMMPVLLLPWLFFPAVWRGLWALAKGSGPRAPGLVVALAWFVPVFLAFSSFRGKQIQYLLPAVPAMAFVIASGLATLDRPLRRWETWVPGLLFAALAALMLVSYRSERVLHLIETEELTSVAWTSAVLAVAAVALLVIPWRDARRHVATVSLATVVSMLGVYAGFGRALFDAYDVHPVSAHLHAAQQSGRPVAHLGKYHGQYQFIGRLRQPIVVFDAAREMVPWLAQHPEGRVVIYTRAAQPSELRPAPEFLQPFKGRHVGVWRAADLQNVSPEWMDAQDRRLR